MLLHGIHRHDIIILEYLTGMYNGIHRHDITILVMLP